MPLLGKKRIRNKLIEQDISSIKATSLCGSRRKADRIAQGIQKCMNFGTECFFAAANSFAPSIPLLPQHCADGYA